MQIATLGSKEWQTESTKLDHTTKQLDIKIDSRDVPDSTATEVEDGVKTDAEDEENDDEEEPFETYKLKVIKLCHDIGFGEPTKLEHMDGGSSHRIVGLGFDSPDRKDYVLRIPWNPWNEFEPNEISDQVSILQHLSQYDFLNVPSILAYDMTVNNALQAQYVLQSRLPGESFEMVYYQLPLAEKLQITAAVAELIIKLETIKFDKPGRLIGSRTLPLVASAPPSSRTHIEITGFRASPHNDMEAFEEQPLRGLIQALKRFRREDDADWPQMVQRCYRLEDIAREMEAAGLMRTTDTQNILWHWDLAARNILIKRVNPKSSTDGQVAGAVPISDPTELDTSCSEISGIGPSEISEGLGTGAEEAEWEITGVLDWDDALSVPLVLSRKPPAWLWFNEDERLNWDGNNDVAPNRELNLDELLIKARFDQIMSKADPTYLEDTYHRGPWLRSLARFGLYGFGDSLDWERYEVFVKEWEEYYNLTGCEIPKDESMGDDKESEGVGTEDGLTGG